MPRSILGLRIDACTFQGLRQGAPRLLEALARRRIHASIFPAMGPDRSGLAVLRVFRKKGFLRKMLRTRAASMYGFRTALYGTLLPAPRIGFRLRDVLRRAAGEGHELGIHAWDHVRWQDHLDRLGADVLREDYDLAMEAYEAAVGRLPGASASPAWIASEASFEAEGRLGLVYASDVRGRGPFQPWIDGRAAGAPQVPLSLPTLDEALGQSAPNAEAFFDGVFRSLAPADGATAPVFCAHAEAEGRAYLKPFESFLDRVLAAGWEVAPLSKLLPADRGALPRCEVGRGRVPGRAGEVSVQGNAIDRVSG